LAIKGLIILDFRSEAGVSVTSRGNVRLLPVDDNAVFDRVIDAVPGLIDNVSHMVKGTESEEEVVTV